MTPAATSAAPARPLTRPQPRTQPRRRRPAPASAPPRRAPTLPARVAALPDARVLVRLTRGRIWIALIGVLLMGLVFMQVSLLQLNTGISNADQSIATLERANQQARTKVAAMGSVDRIQAIAGKMGMVLPTAGGVHFLHSGASAQRAAANVIAPKPVQQLAAWQLPGAATDGVTGAAAAAAAANPTPAAQPEVPVQTAVPAPTGQSGPATATGQ